MAQAEIRVRLPAEVVALFGTTAEAAARAREALVLDLVRGGHISQGKAAEVLGISRHDMLDLLAAYDVATGPQTIEEYRRDLDGAEPFVRAPHA
jgi:hypothetical protein